MKKLSNFHIDTVKKMLHILKTCERDTLDGIGWFSLEERKVSFGGLCELASNLLEDWVEVKQLIDILKNYLQDYPGPKIKGHTLYWFSYLGEEFFEERILFLEYILNLNRK